MAISSCPTVFPSFECRSDPDFSGRVPPRHDCPGAGLRRRPNSLSQGSTGYGLSSLIFRFPPNFVRQLSTKARRNCSNIGVAQIVAASWSNNKAASGIPPAAKALDAAAAAISPPEVSPVAEEEVVVLDNGSCSDPNVQIQDLTHAKYASFLSSDGSVAVHAGMYAPLLSSRFESNGYAFNLLPLSPSVMQ